MKKRILVVDDESVNVYMLQSLLGEEGFDVDTAGNGKEALDKAHEARPDLIISDILMPVMDGYAFCRACKSDEQLRQVPFVFYTATYTEARDEEFALSLGADLFILKPEHPHILIGKISELLEKYHVARPVSPPPLGEEMEFFRRHNEILFGKLEEKMLDLEAANRELKDLEEQYRLSFENITDIVWTIDADGIVQKMSPSVERLLGYRPQDLIGKPISDLVKILAPESAARAMAQLQVVLKGGVIETSVYSLVAKDGTVKYGEFNSSPILSDGRIVGMVSVIRDTTDHKRAEEALRESEEKYRILFNHASEAILVIQGGAIRFANPAAIMLSGYPEEVFLARPFTEFIYPEDRRMVLEYYGKRMRGENVPSSYMFRATTQDGSVKWVEIHATIVTWEGKPATLNFLSDVTERKRAEEALRESEERHRSIFEHSQDAIIVARPDGTILDANEAACDMFGRSMDGLRAAGRDGLVDTTDPRLDVALKERAEKGRARAEITMLRADGKKFPVDITSTIFTDMDGQQKTSMIIRDMTERKRVEEVLRQSEARFRSYFELPLIGIAITSPEKGWLEGNERLYTILGYSGQELKEKTWAELTYPEDLDADVERFNRVLAGEIDSYMLDKRFIRKDGEVIWVSLAAGCVRKQDGTVDYFVALFEDITARKESEERIRKTLGATVHAIAVTVETRDPYTAGHQRRVSDLARAIASEMGLSTDQIEGIRTAGIIHDIGKISVPSELLSKPTRLSETEFSLIKTHAQSGYEILKDIEFLWPVARMVVEHHERMDGSGYPKGLKGDALLLESRVLAVADVVESMASHRPYRPSLGQDAALEEITKNRAVLYDPGVVDACLRLFKEKGYRMPY